MRDYLRVMFLNLLPNGYPAKFYSIGPWRKQHPDWFTEDLAILLDLLVQGKIKPIIAMRLPLNEARHAHSGTGQNHPERQRNLLKGMAL